MANTALVYWVKISKMWPNRKPLSYVDATVSQML